MSQNIKKPNKENKNLFTIMMEESLAKNNNDDIDEEKEFEEYISNKKKDLGI
ncbi:MAG: hypothetical protein PHS54_01505 [Clostridia bacterium]|nr:hypothetical protein [Clostridia bacterium]